MIKRILLVAVILQLVNIAKAQEEDIGLPEHHINKANYLSIRKFIPQGYTVLDQADGDINGDGLVDKVLILKQIEEITEEENRPVLLLVRTKKNVFELAAKNENIVLSLGDGGVHGDPYYGIVIKNNFFSIEHFGGSGWRWNQVITFKHTSGTNKWHLYRITNESWHMDRNSTRVFKRKTQSFKDFGEVDFPKYVNEWREKNN